MHKYNDSYIFVEIILGEILEIAIWPVNLEKAFFSSSFLFKQGTHHRA